MNDQQHDRHIHFLEVARNLRARGESVELVLEALREASATALESIKILCILEGMALREAKDAVHTSEAWSDLRAHTERVHNEALKVLEEEVHIKEEDGVFRGTIDLSKRDVD